MMLKSTRNFPRPDAEILTADIVQHVAQTCLCLHSQRAARSLARLFDTALRPHGLNHGQFSLLMALNRADAPTIGALAQFLAMDRTSLTAALKPLARRNMVQVQPDPTDRRSKLVMITAAGVAQLRSALPTWRDTHARLDAALAGDVPARLRADLRQVPIATSALAPQPEAGA